MTASTDLPAQGYGAAGARPDRGTVEAPHGEPAAGSQLQGEPAPLGFRLIVAPAAGKVRHLPPSQFQDGDEWVSAGQAVALIEQGPSSVTVLSPVAARLAGVLVRDGTPVLPGQPLLWLDQSPSVRKQRPPGRRSP